MENLAAMQISLQGDPSNSNLYYAPPLTQVIRKQPLCVDPEGWGPISEIRYDFTPCFLDVWIISVAAWGIVLGFGAVWYLKRRIAQDVPRNWHYYAKLYVFFQDQSRDDS